MGLFLTRKVRCVQNHVNENLRIVSRRIADKRYQIIFGFSRLLLSRSRLSCHLISCHGRGPCRTSVAGNSLIERIVNIVRCIFRNRLSYQFRLILLDDGALVI